MCIVQFSIYHMCVSRISLMMWLARVNACEIMNRPEWIKWERETAWIVRHYLKHVSRFLSSDRNVIGFVQEIFGFFRFIQMRDQLRLKIVLHIIHQEMHNGLRHRILNRLSYDVEIWFDESLCEWNRNDVSLFAAAVLSVIIHIITDDITIFLFFVGQFAGIWIDRNVRQ